MACAEVCRHLCWHTQARLFQQPCASIASTRASMRAESCARLRHISPISEARYGCCAGRERASRRTSSRPYAHTAPAHAAHAHGFGVQLRRHSGSTSRSAHKSCDALLHQLGFHVAARPGPPYRCKVCPLQDWKYTIRCRRPRLERVARRDLRDTIACVPDVVPTENRSSGGRNPTRWCGTPFISSASPVISHSKPFIDLHRIAETTSPSSSFASVTESAVFP
jgi:hypothetical protein